MVINKKKEVKEKCKYCGNPIDTFTHEGLEIKAFHDSVVVYCKQCHKKLTVFE